MIDREAGAVTGTPPRARLMHRLHRRLSFVLLAASPLWLEAIGHGETIDHGDLGPGTRVGEGFTPEGCDPMPEDPGFIAGLQSGWLREQDGRLHLRLSNIPVACPRSAPSPTELLANHPVCSEDAWSLDFDLPEEMQAPGLYELSEHIVNIAVQQSLQDPPTLGCSAGCGSTTLSNGAVGTLDGHGPAGQIELYSVNATCITGRIISLDQANQIIPPPPKVEGAFRAVRCE